MLQNATRLRKSTPGPPNSSDEHVSCTVPAMENASFQIIFKCPTPLEMLQNPHVLLTFDKVHNPLRLPRESTSKPPKVVRTLGVFNILTSKRASRHNGVHFFEISTSKSGPMLVCFAHFEIEMCFAPQRRALFRHLNFQKWSEREVLLVFSLAHVLRASSRHNGVHFSISHLARRLRTRRFSEPTFRPSALRSHKSLEKQSVSRLSYLFAHLDLLSSDSFSSLIFSLLLFSSL